MLLVSSSTSILPVWPFRRSYATMVSLMSANYRTGVGLRLDLLIILAVIINTAVYIETSRL